MFGGGVAHRKKKCSNVAHPFTHSLCTQKLFLCSIQREKFTLRLTQADKLHTAVFPKKVMCGIMRVTLEMSIHYLLG